MTISFTASGNDVLFAGTVHTTEKSAEAAAEQAAKLNVALKRVISESNGDEPDSKNGPGVNSDEGQFVPFSTDPADDKASKIAKADGMDESEYASKKDPDNNGDDDSSAATDTDHDYWTAGGKQKKALPGKPLPKKEKSKDFSQGQRKSDAKSGAALPDGSFPIESVADLKNAIQAFGRAKDKVAAKAHIKKRAGALGSANLLPDSW